jgi:hypothetical protein
MKMRTRTALARFGGTAALAVAVVLAVVVVLLVAAIPPAPSAPSVTPPPPASAVVAGPLDAAAPGGTGVHIATLTGCISGLNC